MLRVRRIVIKASWTAVLSASVNSGAVSRSGRRIPSWRRVALGLIQVGEIMRGGGGEEVDSSRTSISTGRSSSSRDAARRRRRRVAMTTICRAAMPDTARSQWNSRRGTSPFFICSARVLSRPTVGLRAPSIRRVSGQPMRGTVELYVWPSRPLPQQQIYTVVVDVARLQRGRPAVTAAGKWPSPSPTTHYHVSRPTLTSVLRCDVSSLRGHRHATVTLCFTLSPRRRQTPVADNKTIHFTRRVCAHNFLKLNNFCSK